MSKPARYIGTKTVIAEAMTRAAYNVFRGWELPAGENGEDEGYLVEYTDGGKPNVPGRAGYVSWSPKEQFDKAYVVRPLVAGMLPHQQRVVDEMEDLAERITKLDAFIKTPTFSNLELAEQGRLARQLDAMKPYFEILNERVLAFKQGGA